MITKLDDGVGAVRAALEKAGMFSNSVIAFCSDNGGPLDHATNLPLRGGKHTLWDGGLRVTAWVSSPLFHPDRRGTVWDGLMCACGPSPTLSSESVARLAGRHHVPLCNFCALTLCVLPGPAVACAGTRATGCRPGSLGSRDRTLPLPPGLDRWTGTTCGTHGPARTLRHHALRSFTRSSTSICSEKCLCIRHPKPSIQLNCPCIWIYV
jgi:hypothetical protein